MMSSEQNASTAAAEAPKLSLAAKIREEAIQILKAAAWFLPAWIIFNAVAWAQYSIPSESMVPTMEVGDRVIVAKYPYGYSRFSLPVVWRIMPEGDGRILGNLPKRGDVVVFAHPVDGRTMIKRLIGLPGDVVEMSAGKLIVNGEAAQYESLRQVNRVFPGDRAVYGAYPALEQRETLSGRSHAVMDIDPNSPGDNWGPQQVPAGHLLMMGDNRDNSEDGRFPSMGFVATERLIGRAETVIFAPKGCQGEGLSCARERWFAPLSEDAPK
jgi:signal peptidase I